MLTMFTAPFTEPFAAAADKWWQTNQKLEKWFAKHGHGPNFVQLVKLAPLTAALAVVIGLVS